MTREELAERVFAAYDAGGYRPATYISIAEQYADSKVLEALERIVLEVSKVVGEKEASDYVSEIAAIRKELTDPHE